MTNWTSKTAAVGVPIDVTLHTNETVDKQVTNILAAVEKMADTIKDGINVNSTIHVSDKADQQINELLTTLKTGVPVKVTLSTQSATKTVAFAALGLVIGCVGVKMVYDSYKNISEKLNAPENSHRSWRTILSRGDYVSAVAGLVTLGCGFGLIAKSDALAA